MSQAALERLKDASDEDLAFALSALITYMDLIAKEDEASALLSIVLERLEAHAAVR